MLIVILITINYNSFDKIINQISFGRHLCTDKACFFYQDNKSKDISHKIKTILKHKIKTLRIKCAFSKDDFKIVALVIYYCGKILRIECAKFPINTIFLIKIKTSFS